MATHSVIGKEHTAACTPGNGSHEESDDRLPPVARVTASSSGLRTEFFGNTATLYVDGEVEMSNADDLQETLRYLLDADPAVLCVDMSQVTFCDSVGFRNDRPHRRSASLPGRRPAAPTPSRRAATAASAPDAPSVVNPPAAASAAGRSRSDCGPAPDTPSTATAPAPRRHHDPART